MPNVLLIGGSNALYEMLKSDSRWNVMRAMHASSTREQPSPELGDPRNWHLVIDDCQHTEIAKAEADALVSDDYLMEASRAHSVLFCKSQHDVWSVDKPSGRHDFEANPTNAPGAAHLEDFFDAFHAVFNNHCLFQTHRFGPDSVDLVVNSYERPLALLEVEWPFRLVLIDLADDESRLKAFEYLLYRTVPKLWPEVYSDQFRPRRVVALEEEREREITARRARVAEIDADIDAELSFYAPFTVLTQLADDPLKDLVATAFREVFACEVTDLDDETEEGKPKTLDLLARGTDWCGFIEVRSAGNRAARITTDLEPLDDHAETLNKKYGTPDAKVLVFNGLYRREPEQRIEDALFSQQVANEAQGRGITLLSTQRLLETIEARRNDEMTTAEFLMALKTPGVFTLEQVK